MVSSRLGITVTGPRVHVDLLDSGRSELREQFRIRNVPKAG